MRIPMTAACLIVFAVLPGHAASEPLFPNSVVSNDLDFIRTDDRGVFSCIGYEGEIRTEMPDKRGGELMADGVFSWSAQFKDGTSIEVWVHPMSVHGMLRASWPCTRLTGWANSRRS